MWESNPTDPLLSLRSNGFEVRASHQTRCASAFYYFYFVNSLYYRGSDAGILIFYQKGRRKDTCNRASSRFIARITAPRHFLDCNEKGNFLIEW